MIGELLAAAAVTAVTAVMAATVARQWLVRHRPYQAAWLVALAMAAVASGAYVLFLLLGRPAVLFRLYYLFGAGLNVAFLGLGSLYLAFRRPLHWLVGVLVVLSVVTAWAIFTTPVRPGALLTTTGAGTNVLPTGLWTALVVGMSIFGAISLIGVAVFSAWRSWQRQQQAQRAVANILIAAGALVVSAAGAAARLAGAGAFWLILLVGWIIMYVGFTLASRTRAPAPVMAAPLASRPVDPATHDATGTGGAGL